MEISQEMDLKFFISVVPNLAMEQLIFLLSGIHNRRLPDVEPEDCKGYYHVEKWQTQEGKNSLIFWRT